MLLVLLNLLAMTQSKLQFSFIRCLSLHIQIALCLIISVQSTRWFEQMKHTSQISPLKFHLSNFSLMEVKISPFIMFIARWTKISADYLLPTL